MGKQYATNKKILQYDRDRYPFDEIIADFVDVEALDNLSSGKQAHNENFSFYKNMEQTPTFKRLYQKLEQAEGKRFYDLYADFIKQVIRPLYQEAIYYQTKPSHRILFKDITGEARFHKDSDYGHSSDEVNYWLPQTPAFHTNTIWIEKELGSKDYEPVHLKVGEFLQFNGADFSHGAFPNNTGKTRVSFDFRVIPASKMNQRDLNEAYKDHEGNPIMSNARKFSFCE